ncbi:hypothetical protein WJX77_004170 [Trebouxia sp. C0004]
MASSASAPESNDGLDPPCMIQSSEPKQQQSQGDSIIVSTEQLNPLHLSEMQTKRDDVCLAEDTICIKEHLELSQQQLLGPEVKTTRRFQGSAVMLTLKPWPTQDAKVPDPSNTGHVHC